MALGCALPASVLTLVPAFRGRSEFLGLLATRDGCELRERRRSSHSSGASWNPGARPKRELKPGAWKNKREMADEALFLLLHNEMVSGVYKSAEQGEVVSAATRPSGPFAVTLLFSPQFFS